MYLDIRDDPHTLKWASVRKGFPTNTETKSHAISEVFYVSLPGAAGGPLADNFRSTIISERLHKVLAGGIAAIVHQNEQQPTIDRISWELQSATPGKRRP